MPAAATVIPLSPTACTPAALTSIPLPSLTCSCPPSNSRPGVLDKSTLTSGVVESVSSMRIPSPPSMVSTSPPPPPDPVVSAPGRQPV